MRKQNLIALLLAVIAALMTYYYITEKEAEVRADVTPVKVLVAKKPISRGAELTADKVRIDEIPGAYIMPGTISSPDKKGVVKQWQEFRGQFAVVPMAKGEQILPNKLSKIRPGFADVVLEGQRIVSLALDPAAAVGGHVKPGNRVDVIATFEHRYKNAKRTTTAVLVQNVPITAVGGQTTLDEPTPSSPDAFSGGGRAITVCLAVTPEDAVRLTLAEKEGFLKLALRSIGDNNLIDLPDQNLSTVLGPLMKVRREEIKPASKKIQIIRGMQ